ncbi:hypothetical protein L204_104100 [Cryptococcus depauperatus]|nr:hypothetical protein L204_03253 [Cryptococcus depauperatus CBS 7855]
MRLVLQQIKLYLGAYSRPKFLPSSIHGLQWAWSSSSSPSSSRKVHANRTAPGGQNSTHTSVENAADVSHAQFISSAFPESDFNPTQTPYAGQEAERGSGEWSGRLSPTTSHLFKLVIPLPSPIESSKGEKKGRIGFKSRPTAFLLHPSQPLSHLSRLIAGSLPSPFSHSSITYLALTGTEKDVSPQLRNPENPPQDSGDWADRDEGGPYLRERKGDGRWQEVTWSQSTDLSDFIKQSCLNEKFKIVITPPKSTGSSKSLERSDRLELEPDEITLEVIIPSFASRTHYIRKRLLTLTRDLDRLTRQKKEIDLAAHKGAQRLAVMALGGGVLYWGTVIRFTFFTDAGWDIMEPVTWATGFAALLSSAAFLIYHNREVSYSSLLDLSISARQRRLYAKAGLNLEHWTELVAEAKELRKEVERIARDYDIEWKGELEGLEGLDKGNEKTKTVGMEIEAKRQKLNNDHKNNQEKKNTKGEKIDIDKTIDEASELASQSESQQAHASTSSRKNSEVDDKGGDSGERKRRGEGEESESEVRGRMRARDIINEK